MEEKRKYTPPLPREKKRNTRKKASAATVVFPPLLGQHLALPPIT